MVYRFRGVIICKLIQCVCIFVQGLLCNGGRRNACGRRHLPDVGRSSPTAFIKTVNFDPKGTDHWYCGAVDQNNADNVLDADLNRYTFFGSYYNIYVKLASCDPPKGRVHSSKSLSKLYNFILDIFCLH